MNADERIGELNALLRAAGVGSHATLAGAHGDIAVVHGALPASVLPLAERIRALGFRHVTVDLASLPGAADD